ncbi:MAG: hypothetical protein EA401_00630 [Planctomycetota bacterium]|nr:MAG: hypothetical protein EA401_00630 [Planctomycetota bacterium]
MTPRPATSLELIRDLLQQMVAGSVFTRRDFQGLVANGSLGRILTQLEDDGVIRRLDRGLFFLPRHNPRLGLDIPPSPETIAHAIARKRGWTIIPHGAWAANRLGLDMQVPAQFVCLSDGPSETLTVAGHHLVFKHARPKDLVADDPEVSTLIQALRHVQHDGLDDAIHNLSNLLPQEVCERLLQRTARTSTWLHAAALKLMAAQRSNHD